MIQPQIKLPKLENRKMRVFNRPLLMKAHAILAVFILPIAIMFFVTGALYTWGIKGEYETTIHKIHLEAPMKNQLEELVNLAKKELKTLSISVPTGQAKIKNIGNSFKLEWAGSGMDIIIEPTSQPLIAQLAIKKASWYRKLVQLHKAKGGDPFKVYATVLVVSLILLLITGFIMAWQMPKLRKLTLASTVLGMVFFMTMILSS